MQSRNPATKDTKTGGTAPGRREKRPLAVTMGDPAGIGLDITLMAWLARDRRPVPPFVLFAGPSAVAERARRLGAAVMIQPVQDIAEGGPAFARALPVKPIPLAAPVTPGAPSPANAPAVIAAIEEAVQAAVAGQARAVVTNPISKIGLYRQGFRYPGHTEFLAALAERRQPGRSVPPVMMLVSDELRTVPLTVHMPLAKVPSAITGAHITRTAETVFAALRRDFGLACPRLAVAGLNPHAGEGGALGEEESTVIAPAVRALQERGFCVRGPHPADTLFHEAARKNYDAVLAMYHDQALIPLKTLAFDRGVNVTLGLPFVRTSPDHGTAFAIAGSGQASPESFLASLRLADAMAARREAAAE